MRHVARPESYAAAADEVRSTKTGGYVHVYEFIDMYALDDTGPRKVRRVTQSLPMPELYATLAEALGKELGLTLVAQRPEALLGLTDDLDINADPSPEMFLQRLEAALGPIELDQTDWDTPINEPLVKACRQSAGWRRSSTPGTSRSPPRCTRPTIRTL
jgi:hypothetical protein